MDYDRSNYSEDRALKKYFQDWYQKNGVGPGDDKMTKKLKSYRDQKEKALKREDLPTFGNPTIPHCKAIIKS